MPSLQGWKWGLIGLGIGLFLILGVFLCYLIQHKYKIKKRNEKNSRDAQRTIEEAIVIADSRLVKERTFRATCNSGDQPFDTTYTALSPPKYPRDKKEYLPREITKETEKKYTNIFSLSPSPTKEHSISSMTPVSGDSRVIAHLTPISVQCDSDQSWRGPTPPWTINKH